MIGKKFRKILSSALVICLFQFHTSIAIAKSDDKSGGITEQKGAVKTYSDGTRGQDTKISASEISDKNMMATITMVAVGAFVVTMLRKYDKMTMDMKVVLAGGAAYMAGEIYSNVALKDKLKALDLEFEKKSGESMEAQVEALEELKKGYEEALKTLKTKNMLQMAATAAFGVATGLAAFDAMKRQLSFGKLQAALKQAMATCTSMESNPATAADGAACLGIIAKVETVIAETEASNIKPGKSAEIKTKLMAAMTEIHTLLSSAPPGAQAALASSTSIAAEYANIHQNQTTAALVADNPAEEAVAAPVSFFNHITEKSIIAQALSSFIPKAKASWTSVFGFLGGGAVAFLLATKTALGKQMDKFMATAKLRVIGWGILTGLSYASLAANKKIMKDLEDRINKIDEIIASLLNIENGAQIADSSNSKVDISGLLNGVGSNTVLPNSGSENNLGCLTSDKSSNCESVSKLITESPDFSELPVNLQNLSKQSGDMADKLQGNNTLGDGALNAAAILGGQNNAIQKSLSDVLEKLKKLDGQETQGLSNSSRDDLLTSVSESANKAGGAGALYASMGGLPASSFNNGLSNGKKAITGDKFVPSKVSGSSGGSASKSKSNDFDFKLLKDDPKAIVESSDSPVNIDNDQLAAEIVKEGIGSSDGPSIFEILSHRYYKSGYPKLLEEEQE